MAAKVSPMRSMYAADDVDDRKRDRCGEDGVARICWIFFEPAKCVRIEGHLMAAERSRCKRAFQESGEVYSAGE